MLYFGAGVLHLRDPAPFVAITPPWVPFPREVILVTGGLEIAGALALLAGLCRPRSGVLQQLRWAAGVGLALYALCVWPANLCHAMEGISVGGLPVSWWYHGPRLALQPVLIWAALFAGGVTDRPFRRSG